MQRGLLAAACAVAMMAASSTEAASGWICRATSSTGSWGAGWHTHSRAYATQRALVECAARTPWNRTCYIRWCRRS